MADIKDVIDTLDSASDSFEKVLTKSQKKIYEEALVLIKDLELDTQGRVKQTIGNLKKLGVIKTKLAKVANNDEYLAGIGQLTKYFDALQKEQNAYFAKIFPESTIGVRAKEKRQLMKQIAVQNTLDALTGAGLKANVTDKLDDILLRAVTSNEKFADLQEEFRAHLLGQDGGTGALSRYAGTYAVTAMSQFTGQNNKLLTQDLGIEWFMYVGSTIETTREFCQKLTKKKYIHKSEIPEILLGRIDNERCALYPKTGLPYGMIDGTNVDNFQVNCGGWNCRHQLVPVHELAVPQEIRDRIKAKISNSTDPSPSGVLGKEKGKDAFIKLLKETGFSDFNRALDEFKSYGVDFEIDENLESSKNLAVFLAATRKSGERKSLIYEKEIEIRSIYKTIESIGGDKNGKAQEIEQIVSAAIERFRKGESYGDVINEILNGSRKLKDKLNRLIDTIDYSQDKNVRELAKAIGISGKGKMAFFEADNEKTNPKFKTAEEYTKNCQRCVIAFEMRMRGLNVEAMKRESESNDPFFREFPGIGTSAWTNKNTGKKPSGIKVYGSSLADTKEKIKSATRDPGRYILHLWWGNETSHVINVIRSRNKMIVYYDAQSGKICDFEDLYNRSKDMELWRVDDCDLNVDAAKLSVVALS